MLGAGGGRARDHKLSQQERLVFQSALSEALVIAASSVRQGEAHTSGRMMG